MNCALPTASAGCASTASTARSATRKTEDEYAIALDRHNTVLEELFAGQVYVVTVSWSWQPHGEELPPERQELHAAGARWLTLADENDPGPGPHSYTHLCAERRTWRRGVADDILRAAADDVLHGVLITDTGLRRVHHPYDGGADVITATPEERDRLRDRHPEWLRPTGRL